MKRSKYVVPGPFGLFFVLIFNLCIASQAVAAPRGEDASLLRAPRAELPDHLSVSRLDRHPPSMEGSQEGLGDSASSKGGGASEGPMNGAPEPGVTESR